ncbi:MAG: LacI family transcriptional regulator [Ruminococcaceae bacterium]|nr:LacI family transcriptional regulator [Oscillospiraceae bacterium]
MNVTMKDIAVASGVSTTTVSKVLNGRDNNISAVTRNRILENVKKYGYVPNAVAKGLRTQRTNTLGFILPDICNPFFPEIVRGIEDVANSKGFSVIISNTDNNAQRELASFRGLASRMVDGIIFTRALRPNNIEEYANANIPVVVVDREINISGFGFGMIAVDTQRGIYDATKLLLDKGCKRIAYISADYDSEFDRYTGYKKAITEAGASIDNRLVYRRDYDVATGYEGIRKILSSELIDGVVCGNDLIAVGVINALNEANLSVPLDVKVIGFDDVYFGSYINPALTTIKQPAYEIGSEAAKMLIDNILYDVPLSTKILDYTLIIRDSV